MHALPPSNATKNPQGWYEPYVPHQSHNDDAKAEDETGNRKVAGKPSKAVRIIRRLTGERTVVEKPAKPVFVPFDASVYPCVDADNIPPGRASVPVQLDDDGFITECVMTAGMIGMRVSSSGEDLDGKFGRKGMDTISIEPGWWMTRK